MSRNKHDCDIILGPEVTLRSLPRLARQLEHSAFTPRTLRLFCQALSVPCIQIDKTWYVNVFWFKTAVHAVSRLGEADFLAPGCEQIRQGRTGDARRTLTREDLATSLRTITAEMVAIRHSEALRSGEPQLERRTAYIAQRLSQTVRRGRERFSGAAVARAAASDTIPHHLTLEGASPWKPPSPTPSPSSETDSSFAGTPPPP